MTLYAVSLKNEGAYHFGDAWIEFYWADDADHAREQADDANASAEILCVVHVPYVSAEALEVAAQRVEP